MQFHQKYPVYICIANMLCEQLVKGVYKPNERFPSVRDYAAEIGVNPNTVARSFEHLSERGVITNQRGVGYFVTEKAVERILEEERAHFLQEELPYFLAKAKMLNINIKDQIK